MTKQKGSLDGFDREILRIVQESCRITAEDIGEEIGLSTASVQRRLSKMKKNGTIIADVSIVSREAIGRPLTFIVEVTMERESTELMDRFKKEIIKNEIVQQCYYVTGSTDFILVITAEDMMDYDRFTKEHFFDNSNIRSFRTNVVMDSVKIGLFVPTKQSIS